jgi:cell division protein FtsN
VLVLFGAIFSLGVLVGRQIASSTLAAPQQPAPGDLAALDAANRAPKPPKVVAPPAEEPKKEPAKAEHEAAKGEDEKPDASAPADEKKEPAKAEHEPAKAAEDEEAARARFAAQRIEAKAPKPEPKRPEPEPEPEPKPKPEPKPAPIVIGRYTVQLGASPDEKVAQKLMAKARSAGFDVHVLEVDLGAKGTWYRVRVGSYGSKDEAAKVQRDAERQLRVPAMVMPAQ